MNQLSGKVADDMMARKVNRVAVLEFIDEAGQEESLGANFGLLGKFCAEKLESSLTNRRGNFRVVDQRRLRDLRRCRWNRNRRTIGQSRSGPDDVSPPGGLVAGFGAGARPGSAPGRPNPAIDRRPGWSLGAAPFRDVDRRPGAQPKYLLDAGPPIIYASSATVLQNLVERRLPPAEPKAGQQPVLTVGRPRYGNPDALPAGLVGPDANRPDSNGLKAAGAAATSPSRLGRRRGQLTDLPFTGTESQWVADVIRSQGIAVAALREQFATEAAVRENVPGRRIVHLACHGLTDQAYGNFFGCLALTPNNPTGKNSADDGFLSLPEIYELNLQSCELAVLSACQTNYGPQQQGESVWALSRGFLVAGARRVVASNWLVDDEAAASLISVFCSGVAKGEKAGSVDYA